MKYHHQSIFNILIYSGLAASLAACAVVQPGVSTANVNPRLVQTDLTQPYYAWFEPEQKNTLGPIDSSEASVLAPKAAATSPEVKTRNATTTAALPGSSKAKEPKQARAFFRSLDFGGAAVQAKRASIGGTSSTVATDLDALPRAASAAANANPLQLTPAATLSQDTAEPIYVKFLNESARLNSSDSGYQQLLSHLDDNAQFFVIGHSHGSSAVGVAKLSQQRAEAVASALSDAGVDLSRVHTMAAWSASGVDFAPSLGVQVFIVKSPDPKRVLLAFSQ